MKDIKIFSVLFVIFLYQFMQSCESVADEAPVVIEQRSFANVDERLWSFFEEFEELAAERSLDFDLTTFNLTGIIEDVHEEGVIGTCSYGFRGPRDVVIDAPFWNNTNIFGREMVVFHELGHCILGRDHTEARTGNGFCASIMTSGTGDCRTLYNAQNRDYYIDELFELITP